MLIAGNDEVKNVTIKSRRSPDLFGFVLIGMVRGLAAWSAYAVLEFLASSVIIRLTRPYARFTTWHWALTGLLAAGYLAAGTISGILLGVMLFLLRNTRRLSGGQAGVVIGHAATFILMLAITLHVATQPAAPDIWWKLILIPVALLIFLGLSIYSQVWSERFGLLVNPWVAAALFLGGGQISALQFLGMARQLGIFIQPWYYAGIGILWLVALAAAVVGRRCREAWDLERTLSWMAISMATILMTASFGLGIERDPLDRPQVPLGGDASRPNVVLIVMDAVRADHLSVGGYGRDTTPNLRKLAADATWYSQAVSAADVTLSSHASIFTSLYPSWHGAYCHPPDADFGRPIGPVPTMAELLEQSGYHTLGVAANLYLRSQFGLERGFQQFRIPRPVPVLPTESWYMLRNAMRRVIGWFTDTAQFDRLYSRGDAVNREFFAMLRKQSPAQAPFFAFFNYMDAHFPYIPPAPFDGLFPGREPGIGQADLAALARQSAGGRVSLVYTRHTASQYDGGIAYMDAQIGQLVNWLKREGQYENTMIIVTADHGESFGEKGLFQHGNSVYANLLHVGLLVKYPHSAHIGVVNTPVSLVDILPTVLKAAGVKAPASLQGEDLLDPAATAPRKLFSESFPCPVTHEPECPAGCTMRAVVSWPDKYIFTSSGKSELYELRQDPQETHNLLGSRSQTAQSLSTELNAWVRTMPAGQNPIHVAGAGRALPSAMLRRPALLSMPVGAAEPDERDR